MIQKGYKTGGILQGFLLIVAIAYIIKLFLLQIISPQYKEAARDNVVKKQTIYPSRGLIVDRKGKVIVYNDAVYDILVNYSQLKKQNDFDTILFCQLLNTTPKFVRNKLEEIRWRTPNRPTPLLKLVDQGSFARFQEHLFQFPAFSFQTRMVRRYPYYGAAHMLGYLAEVTDKDLEERGDYYEQGDYVGKTGIEYFYENLLRGEKGERYQVMDVRGRLQGSYKQGKEDKLPTAGADLITTIDAELQSYGEKLMHNKLGSIIAIEPTTGEILAFVSSPGYDPNLLAGRYRGHNFSILYQDKNIPLINRPITATYPPGSTFKIASSLVVFNNNIHSPQWNYFCRGGYYMGSHRVKCHGSHAVPDVQTAIKYSCNSYYCQIFRDMVMDSTIGNPEKGYKLWRDGIMKFGFGKKTGIDLKGEKSGNIPSVEYYNKIHGKNKWVANNIISVAIGQGEVLATPLQMANEITAIANRGYYITPHLVRYYTKDKKNYFYKYKKEDLGITDSLFESTIDGLAKVVESGTGKSVRTDMFVMCGKTGTAQNPHGKDHSMFVAFAPRDKPKIAIAVVVENSGFGATYAAPITSLMIEKYLNDTISDDRKRIAMQERMYKANLLKWKPEVDTSAKVPTAQ